MSSHVVLRTPMSTRLDLPPFTRKRVSGTSTPVGHWPYSSASKMAGVDFPSRPVFTLHDILADCSRGTMTSLLQILTGQSSPRVTLLKNSIRAGACETPTLIKLDEMSSRSSSLDFIRCSVTL